MLSGLLASPKHLPPKWFYDAPGSELFEQITCLPEYYLTRTEQEILRLHSGEMVEAAGSGLTLVELGAGSATKTGLLLQALLRRQLGVVYVPVDVSRSALVAATRRLRQFPAAASIPVIAVTAHAGATLWFADVCATVLAFGLYTTAVTTLASRRQNLFLKRLRSTAASDPVILSGLMLPISVISLVQVTVILGVFGAVSGSPADVALLAVSVALAFVMMLALGLATAGLTRSPEHAQVTTLPLSLGIVAVATWVGITGTEHLTLLKRLLPGGSAAELVVDSWNGGVPRTESLLLLAPTLAWVVVAIALATKLFSWEPRR